MQRTLYSENICGKDVSYPQSIHKQVIQGRIKIAINCRMQRYRSEQVKKYLYLHKKRGGARPSYVHKRLEIARTYLINMKNLLTTQVLRWIQVKNEYGAIF